MSTSTLEPIRALTVTSTRSTSTRSTSDGRRTPRAPRVAAGDKHVLINDPPSGTTVQMSVGRQLALRFPPRVGASRWRIAARPEHLVPLAGEVHELCFLVFGGAPGRVRLERVDPRGGPVQEVRELYVVPTAGGVSPGATGGAMPARTPRTASRRTASR